MPTQDLYPNVNSVVSNIIEQDVVREPAPVSPDAILVIGTATKGPLYQPIRINDANITELFGASPNDLYGQTSLVKGYKEMVGSMGTTTDIVAIRVGNATKASVSLYEHREITSGDLQYTGDTVALTIDALTEGEEGNSVEARVRSATPDGETPPSPDYPTQLDITTPEGTSVFPLSVMGVGGYARVSELAAAINADTLVSAYVQATSNVLQQTEIVDIVSGSVSGHIETRYDMQSVSGSYGDKMLEITEAYTQDQFEDTDSVLAGVITATLENTPMKDADENTETIDEFWRKPINEVLIGPVLFADVGTTALPLDAAGDSFWVAGEIESLVVTKTDGNGTVTTLTLTTDYTVNVNTGIVTLVGVGAQLNETYKATYEYQATYVEANVRSALQSGNQYSYFVGGDTILFGATQSYSLTLKYQAKNNFQVPRDIAVDDDDDGIIQFRNPDNEPSVGDSVSVTFLYEPELPARAGSSLASGRFQASSLTGGSDGRRLSGAEYYSELAKGYLAADNIPIRHVVPQGVYLDDVLDGIDYETGLPSERNAGYHSQLSLFLRRKSQYVSECEGYISTQPLIPSSATNNPTLTEKEAWYNALVTVSATETTRAANVMATFDDYHVTVLTGSATLLTAGIYGNRPYVDGFANIYAAMRFHHNNLDSMINKRVPTNVIQDMIYPVLAMDRVNEINAARYTMITRHSQDGSIIVADAPTAARASSQFNRQYNVAIVFEAVNAVRSVLDQFIGKPNKNAVRQSMETTAKMVLREMTPDKLLSFDVKVIADRNDAISGKTRVKLILLTANEIRKIEIETRMQLGFE